MWLAILWNLMILLEFEKIEALGFIILYLSLIFWVFCVCFPRKFIGLWVCWKLVYLLGLWV